MIPGTSGLILGPCISLTLGTVLYLSRRGRNFNLDPKNVPGTFEPFLTKYLRVAEFVIGLATGSIVLLVGSAALHSQGRVPWFYASPLVLLAWSVIFGTFFMVWMIYEYEDHSHGGHTRHLNTL